MKNINERDLPKVNITVMYKRTKPLGINKLNSLKRFKLINSGKHLALLDEGSTFSYVSKSIARKCEEIKCTEGKTNKTKRMIHTLLGTVELDKPTWVEIQIRTENEIKTIPAIVMEDNKLPLNCELLISNYDYRNVLKIDREEVARLMDDGKRNFDAPFKINSEEQIEKEELNGNSNATGSTTLC